MVKAVIFDCFGVLVDEVYGAAIKRYMDINEDIAHVNDLADLGQIDEAERTRRFKAIIGDKGDDFLEYLAEVRKHASWHKDLLNDILKLRSSYKTAVLSNTSAAMFAKFFPDDTAERYFDQLVLSYEEGVVKPDPEIFIRAADRLGVSLEECVFVDDSDRNVTAAARLGMKTILYQGEVDFRRQMNKFGVSI
jgi:HAD superfamily hydrolase (TIGR01509 family)